jgi:8-oxo-dGTP pyrophosphatase MutT (NUDIX family)
MSLINDIEAYKPFNEQEEKDKALILNALRNEPDIFTRKNTICHMTASAWVVNKDYSKVLMCFHNIYHSWSWLGGHADGETDLLSVALREVREESGVTDIVPVSTAIFSLESLTVDGHIKHGEYVSSHLHLNVTYLLMADDKDPLFVKADENSKLGWFTPEKALEASSEPWFKEHIYSKLNAKVKDLLSKSSK